MGEADSEELAPWGGVEEDMRKADMAVACGQQPGEARTVTADWCLGSGISCVLNKKTIQHTLNGYFFLSSCDFYTLLNFTVFEYHSAVNSAG